MFKLSSNHWSLMIEFMEKNQIFARGQFSGPTGKASQRKMWEELSQSLNSLGYGFKNVEKWQKSWSDIKYIIKRKCSMQKVEQNKTGGGLGPIIKLNPFEGRILAILGKSFSEGVGSSECGIPSRHSEAKPVVKPSTITSLPCLKKPSRSNLSSCNYACTEPYAFEVMESNPTVAEDDDDDRVWESLDNHGNEVLTHDLPRQASTGNKTPKLNISNEHNYSGTSTGTGSSTRKNKSQQDMYDENKLYKETIEELRGIKKGVFQISSNLGQINKTLKQLK